MDLHLLDWQHPLWRDSLATLPHDIYHRPDYLYCEALRTHSDPGAYLLTEADHVLFIPHLRRPCPPISGLAPPTQTFDIVSPDGYSGFLLSESALQAPDFFNRAWLTLSQHLQSHNICSAFLRMHPILNQIYPDRLNTDLFAHIGTTVSIDLTLSEAERWSQTHKSQRNKINRCKRLGMTTTIVPFIDHVETFNKIYRATMERVNASAKFATFNDAYFDHLAHRLDSQLFLCLVKIAEDIVAAGLYSECSGIVQGLLGGTTTEALKLSPTSLEFHDMSQWAQQRGNKFLHLGGGVGGSEDKLYNYKACFSKQRHPLITLSMITDRERYDALVQQHAQSQGMDVNDLINAGFFPAYRAYFK